jgi:hypothetical protein
MAKPADHEKKPEDPKGDTARDSSSLLQGSETFYLDHSPVRPSWPIV